MKKDKNKQTDDYENWDDLDFDWSEDMSDRNTKNNIVVNELYNKKKKGFYFYIQNPEEDNCATVKYFLSDKDMSKRNLNIMQLVDYIKDCCWRYGIQDGIKVVDSYYKLD